MKVVILAGGFGTRITEESHLKPKPMVEIGEKPILWHIMKAYSHFGFNDFIICLGYKGDMIKNYFAHYFLYNSDVTFDFSNNGARIIHEHTTESWRVTLVDTGLNTMTGGRIKRIQKYIGNETFMLTYGDGVSDVNLKSLSQFHKKSGKYATLTAIQLKGKFGALGLDSERVTSFVEKPKGDGSWINGGFFVLEPAIFDYIEGDKTFWEREPLEKLAKDEQLTAYKHCGFWKCMDTLRDKRELEELWNSGNPPWKVWR